MSTTKTSIILNYNLDDKVPREANDGTIPHISSSQKLLALSMRLSPSIPDLTLEYMGYLQDKGDTEWIPEGLPLGKSDVDSHNIEGFGVRLQGKKANNYSVRYRSLLEGGFKTGWQRNGKFCGTRDENKAIESIQVQFLSKAEEIAQGILSIFDFLTKYHHARENSVVLKEEQLRPLFYSMQVFLEQVTRTRNDLEVLIHYWRAYMDDNSDKSIVSDYLNRVHTQLKSINSDSLAGLQSSASTISISCNQLLGELDVRLKEGKNNIEQIDKNLVIVKSNIATYNARIDAANASIKAENDKNIAEKVFGFIEKGGVTGVIMDLTIKLREAQDAKDKSVRSIASLRGLMQEKIKEQKELNEIQFLITDISDTLGGLTAIQNLVNNMTTEIKEFKSHSDLATSSTNTNIISAFHKAAQSDIDELRVYGDALRA